MSETLPIIVLGGSGYVAGELLRLIAQHPRLELAGTVSSSRQGEEIALAFGHLATLYPSERFISMQQALEGLSESPRWIVVSAAPHGASATLVDQLLEKAEQNNLQMTVVDASADFRYASAEGFSTVYGQAHLAPNRLASFSCAVPEHLDSLETPHAAQPGCFATAMLLAIVPLLSLGLAQPEFFVSAVTGSTGAGRTPRDTTHHPMRQSNLFAYQPLRHRHQPEVCELARTSSGRDIALHFVPQSGPFARGIHATIFSQCTGSVIGEEIAAALAEFYANSDFVHVAPSPPRLKDIVGTNNAVLSVNVEDGTIAICCVLDNLVKGAAGGAIQWVNRLADWPDSEGLVVAPAGWV